jgi:hypothetical protein
LLLLVDSVWLLQSSERETIYLQYPKLNLLVEPYAIVQ